uniref:Ubiquitin carboxyl-terminal hydrolase n=1 Tax=Macrostomum lignano TaxID=282301 RepID=A0A1I8FRP1_9PLAT
ARRKTSAKTHQLTRNSEVIYDYDGTTDDELSIAAGNERAHCRSANGASIDSKLRVMDKQPALIMSEQDEQEQKLHQDEQEQETRHNSRRSWSYRSITIDSARTDSSDIYHVKWIRHAGKQHPVVTQNIKRTVSLLAIANILLLRGLISLPSGCDIYSKFEYTPELDIFDRFNIELVHGWVLDPQQCDVAQFIEQLTYNQLV